MEGENFFSYLYFVDSKEILAEESQKKKCSWFQSGYCQFGSACRFSHCTQEQLDELRQQGGEKRLEAFILVIVCL